MTPRIARQRINERLDEIRRLLDEALPEGQIDAQPRGKPPQPDYTKRVEREIWRIWDKLEKLPEITVRRVRKLIQDSYCQDRTNASFSTVLSDWAENGYLEIVRQGSGPRPTVYRVPPAAGAARTKA
jgi:hypothetical protein